MQGLGTHQHTPDQSVGYTSLGTMPIVERPFTSCMQGGKMTYLTRRSGFSCSPSTNGSPAAFNKTSLRSMVMQPCDMSVPLASTICHPMYLPRGVGIVEDRKNSSRHTGQQVTSSTTRNPQQTKAMHTTTSKETNYNIIMPPKQISRQRVHAYMYTTVVLSRYVL